MSVNQIAQRIVQQVVKNLEKNKNPLHSYVREDPNLTFHKQAKALYKSVENKALEMGVGVDEVIDQCATVLHLRILESEIRSRKRASIRVAKAYVDKKQEEDKLVFLLKNASSHQLKDFRNVLRGLSCYHKGFEEFSNLFDPRRKQAGFKDVVEKIKSWASSFASFITGIPKIIKDAFNYMIKLLFKNRYDPKREYQKHYKNTEKFGELIQVPDIHRRLKQKIKTMEDGFKMVKVLSSGDMMEFRKELGVRTPPQFDQYEKQFESSMSKKADVEVVHLVQVVLEQVGYCAKDPVCQKFLFSLIVTIGSILNYGFMKEQFRQTKKDPLWKKILKYPFLIIVMVLLSPISGTLGLLAFIGNVTPDVWVVRDSGY